MLSELLQCKAMALRNIIRFSLWPRNYNESVAEHSFYVVLYAREIAIHLKREHGAELDLLRVCNGAIYHDCEEPWTSDFPRTFREVPEVKAMLDRCVDVIAKKYLSAELYALWRIHQDDSPEGQVIRFADWLAGLQYIIRECNSGQTAILEKYEDQAEFIEHDLQVVKDSSPICEPLFEELDEIAKKLFKLFRRIEKNAVQ